MQHNVVKLRTMMHTQLTALILILSGWLGGHM
jgi:hypothetical protein